MVKVNRLGIHRRRCCKTHFHKSVAVAAHNGGVLLRLLSRCYVRGLVALGLLGLATPRCFCQWQPSSILCNAGSGKFDAESPTHVAVHIAATKQGSLSMRSCTATLNWGNQSLIVATAAAQVDLDVFAGDFGDAVPVTAFLIKQADSDCCMQYAIYSLKKPPRLLRTIAGGEFFSASDIDLDGNVEIFTEDAFAVRDFDHITLGEMDLAPPLVLRFVHSHLQDVSAEFQPSFDRRISELRAAALRKSWKNLKIAMAHWQKCPPERQHKTCIACDQQRSRCWRSSGPIFTADARTRRGKHLQRCGLLATLTGSVLPCWQSARAAFAARLTVRLQPPQRLRRGAHRF